MYICKLGERKNHTILYELKQFCLINENAYINKF